MNRSRFIQGLKGDIQLSEKERKRIIRKSLQKYSWKTKCTVVVYFEDGMRMVYDDLRKQAHITG